MNVIAKEPDTWKMGDLCKKLNISKSTMFSLLHTMESLQWITKNKSDTYSLGIHYGMMGNAFFNQFDLVTMFHQEAASALLAVEESIQLARLEGNQVLYLAKMKSNSPIQMVSGPGARFPAHATGLGKALLSGLPDAQLRALYPNERLEQFTPYTIGSAQQLLSELEIIKRQGYAEDRQEGVMGFYCVAAPVYQGPGSAIAAVSISMPVHQKEAKKELAIAEVIKLAERLSFAT